MSTLSAYADVVAVLAFAIALAVVLSIPSRGLSPFSLGAKWFAGVAIASQALVVLNDLARWGDRTSPLEPFAASLELLWVPFAGFAVYSLFLRQQLLDATTAKQGAAAANDLLRSIVDTAPTGIIVLEPGGAISFANDAALHLLDLDEPALRREQGPSGFTVRTGLDVGMESARPDFGALVTSRALSDVEVVVEWPNGWRRRLTVNTAPSLSADGSVIEVVAAFAEVEPWRTVSAK